MPHSYPSALVTALRRRASVRSLAALGLVSTVLCTTTSLRIAAAGQAPTSPAPFTAAQADRGQTLYAAQCASCHAADLTGSTTVPPLKGMEFDSYWSGKAAGELFEKVSVTMPKTKPGSLTPAQSADLVAYILREFKATAGSTELGTNIDDLNKLAITRPQ